MSAFTREQLTKEEWNAFVQQQGEAVSFLQSWEWGDLQMKAGRDVETFRFGDVGAQVIRYPLPFGKSYLYAPRGPIGDFRSEAELLELSRAIYAWAGSSALFLRIDPLLSKTGVFFEIGFQEAPDNAVHSAITNPSSVAVLDISGSDDEIMARLKSKARYNIRLAERHSVVTKIVGVEALPNFLKLLQETADRAGFSLHPEKHYRDIMNLFNKNTFIVEARHDGDLLASIMVLCWSGAATYLFGGSTREKSEMMASYAVHWLAIREAKNRGYTEYDFGAIVSFGEDNSRLSGMTSFKLRFGADERHFAGPLDIVYSRHWYNIYNFVRNFKR